MKESDGARARSRDFGAAFRSFVYCECGGLVGAPRLILRLIRHSLKWERMFDACTHIEQSAKREGNAYGYGHHI